MPSEHFVPAVGIPRFKHPDTPFQASERPKSGWCRYWCNFHKHNYLIISDKCRKCRVWRFFPASIPSPAPSTQCQFNQDSILLIVKERLPLGALFFIPRRGINVSRRRINVLRRGINVPRRGINFCYWLTTRLYGAKAALARSKRALCQAPPPPVTRRGCSSAQ